MCWWDVPHQQVQFAHASSHILWLITWQNEQMQTSFWHRPQSWYYFLQVGRHLYSDKSFSTHHLKSISGPKGIQLLSSEEAVIYALNLKWTCGVWINFQENTEPSHLENSRVIPKLHSMISTQILNLRIWRPNMMSVRLYALFTFWHIV